MTKTEAIRHFGTLTALANELGRAKSSAHAWKERLPRGVQFEIQVKTNGALKADQDLFKTRNDQ